MKIYDIGEYPITFQKLWIYLRLMLSDSPPEVEVNLSSVTISNRSLVRAEREKKCGIPPVVECGHQVSFCTTIKFAPGTYEVFPNGASFPRTSRWWLQKQPLSSFVFSPSQHYSDPCPLRSWCCGHQGSPYKLGSRADSRVQSPPEKHRGPRGDQWLSSLAKTQGPRQWNHTGGTVSDPGKRRGGRCGLV